MKRRILTVGIAISILLWTGLGYTFQNEPEGFRGLKWGDYPTPDMEFFIPDQDDPVMYIRPGEKLELGEAALVFITYTFYKASYNRRELVTVCLHFAGDENWQIMKDICREKFGEPYQDRVYSIIWMSLNVVVGLDWNFLDQKGILMMADSNRLTKYEE